MDDHGSEPDPRAAAALAALREERSRPAPPAGAGRWWPPAAAALAAAPRRAALLGVGAVLAVAVVLAGAWVALRPGPPVVGDDALFSAPVTTTDTAGPAPGAAPGAASTTTAAPSVLVHAAGAVVAPGLYRLPAGARVDDLLAAAGGPAPDADVDRLNLAGALADGQRLFVPRVGEQAPAAVAPDGGGAAGGAGGPTAAGGGPAAGPVDLNTATAEQLDALPGVGPATAAAIVGHRDRNGPFATVDDLLDVRGIGPAKLEALRDLVAVG